MPNGGIDNCGTCPYNKANIGKPEHIPYYAWQEGKELEHFCTLRNFKITYHPFWTYCWNHPYVSTSNEDSSAIRGPVFICGLSEGLILYPRIPWDTKTRIQLYFDVKEKTCVCGKKVKKGIIVDGDDFSLFFCSNECYLKWWEENHPGEKNEPNWKGQRLFPAAFPPGKNVSLKNEE